ncbi:helix-turn-helix domain-containing protein [Natrinema versiforme]|uniref:Bacterio-opsin activator HTH domain-containing protein n=1 Tax=Natrinema versiforme JCM 10478 TaxID=1227496 RepID=L9XZJ3_9EURY|nr:helix-turn-helix domain-containing protein [Natrinema versiforme]ELY66861.1 bacterio-opsin activator HTH domain-containing protein [Natrinema versiforme JCM 10478]
MTIEASFIIDQSDFPLSAVFEQLPDATIELDRVVPTSEAVIPYFWIHAEDTANLSTDLSSDLGIEQVKIIDELEKQIFVRIDWNLAHESVLTAVVNTDVNLISGIGNNEQWTFEIRADEQQEISDFQSYCQDNDIPIELTQLHALSTLKSDREYDLTEGQRSALVLAYSRGYFDSPRGATQADLADELEISRQAVSSRLHRGLRRLVASTLITSDE